MSDDPKPTMNDRKDLADFLRDRIRDRQDEWHASVPVNDMIESTIFVIGPSGLPFRVIVRNY